MVDMTECLEQCTIEMSQDMSQAGNSAGKEYTCNAGDGLIPGSGRSPGEGIG